MLLKRVHRSPTHTNENSLKRFKREVNQMKKRFSPGKLGRDFHGPTYERLAEAVLHASVEFRVVIEFGQHGDGVLGVWIFRISGIEFVEGHEVDFTGQSPFVDLFQEDGLHPRNE